MTPPPRASGDAVAADGRVRRGERSRQAIVRALFELVRGEQRLSVKRAQAASEAVVLALVRGLPG